MFFVVPLFSAFLGGLLLSFVVAAIRSCVFFESVISFFLFCGFSSMSPILLLLRSSCRFTMFRYGDLHDVSLVFCFPLCLVWLFDVAAIPVSSPLNTVPSPFSGASVLLLLHAAVQMASPVPSAFFDVLDFLYAVYIQRFIRWSRFAYCLLPSFVI